MQEMMNNLTAQLSPLFGSYIPNLVMAMAILLVGWLMALVVASMVGGALYRTGMSARLACWFSPGSKSGGGDVERWTKRGLFYVLMLFVLLAVFQTLQLTQVTEPMNRLLMEVKLFAPRLLNAGLLLAIAGILASILRVVIAKGLGAAQVDRRLGGKTGFGLDGKTSLGESIADVVYWFIFLLFLPAILGALALEGLLAPVNSMMHAFLGFLPNLAAAGIILLVGWFIAKVIQRIVTGLLASAGADRLSERLNLRQVLGTHTLSGAVGLIVYVLILIPVMIGVLNALSLDSITQPASNMLTLILGAIPEIAGAALLLLVAYIVGRVVATIVTNLLTGIGFNTILARVGLTQEKIASGAKTPAGIVGTLMLVTVMIFAAMEAAKLLGFGLLANLISEFTVFAGHVLLGLVIFSIGLYLAHLASQAIQTSKAVQAGVVAKAAYVAIVGLATAMALREMGLAEEIVNLAFGLILGALAVAFAIALGLGGREIASQELKKWLCAYKAKSQRAVR